MDKMKVGFICVHNSCRSQIAEAMMRHLGSDIIDAYSAGTEKKDRMNPDAVRLMKLVYNIDMEETQKPKLLEDLPPLNYVVTMGCGVECPNLGQTHGREDWGLDDPTGKPDDEFFRTIHLIEEKTQDLLGRIREAMGRES